MMVHTKIFLKFLLVGCLAACSSDPVDGVEGTGLHSPPDIAKASGASRVASGVVSGFGSVYVNGQRVNVSNAQVLINGQTQSELELSVGMNLHLQLDDEAVGLSASSVEYDHYLLGPLEAVNRGRQSLQVLDQEVLITPATRFINASMAATSQNDGTQPLDPDAQDFIAVSGCRNEQGQLLASLVMRLPQPYNRMQDRFSIEGRVSALSADGSPWLRIGELTVDTSMVVVDESIAPLVEGSLVEISGAQALSSGTFNATEVQVLQRHNVVDGGQLSLHGVVSQIVSESVWVVDGVRVQITNAERQDRSGQAVEVGSEVIAAGTVQSQALIASTYTLLPATHWRHTGQLEISDDTGFTLYGMRFETLPTTIYEDKRAQADRLLRAHRLRAGDNIDVHGHTTADGDLAVSVLERYDQPSAGVVGPLQICDTLSSELLVADVTMSVSVDTEFLIGDKPVGFGQFCFSAAAGTQVHADGVQAGTQIQVTRVVAESD